MAKKKPAKKKVTRPKLSEKKAATFSTTPLYPILFRQKLASGHYAEVSITPVAGMVLGFDGSGNFAAVSPAPATIPPSYLGTTSITAAAGNDPRLTLATTASQDLPDVAVSGSGGQLAVGKTSNITSGGSFTSPSLPSTVGTPPARFAVKAPSTGTATVTYPNAAGTSETITILAGEVVTFRQKSTSGWGAESGNKPLTQLDLRYVQFATAPLLTGTNFTGIPQSGVTGLIAALAATATDSAVVHLAGTETITGAKTFSSLVTFADGAVNKASTGQLLFGTSSNVLYLYTGTGGLTINNQANTAQLLSLTNAGALTLPGNASVGGLNITAATNPALNFGGSLFLTRTAAGTVAVGTTQGGTDGTVLTTNLFGAGGFSTGLVTKSAAYTATVTDHKILVDSTSAARTITLPTAVGIAGKEFIVKDWKGTAATNNITIATTGGQTIDGAATKVIASAYFSISFVSDGQNWAMF